MKRSTVGLAGILVALIVIAYVLTLKPGETSVAVTEGEMLVHLDSALVSKLDISSSSGTVVLEQKGPEWYITSPIEDKADPQPIGSAVQAAAGMRVKGIVSTKTEKHSLFQVDSAGTTVTFHQSGKDPVTVVIGKASTSFSETYVRKDGSDDVALVDGSLSWIFSKPIKDWRNRSILSVPRESIVDVRYAYGDTTFSVMFTDSVWTVGGKAANQSSVNSLLSSLASLQCDDFLEAPPSQRRMATITLSGVTISFSYNATEKKYYAKSSSDERWFVLESWRANQVLKREKDLL